MCGSLGSWYFRCGTSALSVDEPDAMPSPAPLAATAPRATATRSSASCARPQHPPVSAGTATQCHLGATTNRFAARCRIDC